MSIGLASGGYIGAPGVLVPRVLRKINASATIRKPSISTVTATIRKNKISISVTIRK